MGREGLTRTRAAQQTVLERVNPMSRYCPKCNTCGTATRVGKKVVCPNAQCGFVFCKTCNGKHHKWRPCMPDKKRLQMMAWAMFRNAKPCPKCACMLQKNGGCPHMKCGMCQYNFCWGCRRALYTATDKGQKVCPGTLIGCLELLIGRLEAEGVPRYVEESL